MLPRWHILLGLIFSVVFWLIFPNTQGYNVLLIFLASFLIDFDHYANAVFKSKKIGLLNALQFYKISSIAEVTDIKLGIKRKGDFHPFHTIEFHIIIGLLGFAWSGFFYILIGMVFHSFLDILHMSKFGRLHRREFLFFLWIRDWLKIK